MKTLVVLPAWNEAPSLPRVLGEIAAYFPPEDVLVVDDGSDDSTPQRLRELGVRSLRQPERRGVGAAIRLGLRHAHAHGYGRVLRIDADGQHLPARARALCTVLDGGGVDAVVGSRHISSAGYRSSCARALARRALSYGLSLRLGHRVTDATSGFWAFGPRAIALLSEHHPDGYGEPQLRLVLARARLSVEEVAAPMRERFAGRTTLTPLRAVCAFSRAAMSLISTPGNLSNPSPLFPLPEAQRSNGAAP